MNANELADELETQYKYEEASECMLDAAKMLREFHEMEEFFKKSDPMGYQAYLARNVK